MIALRCLALLVAVASLAGCKEGCLDGGANCRVPSPCQRLSYSCGDHQLELRVIARGDRTPGGPDARAAAGDILLGNSEIVAVVAGLGNQHDLDPNGGSLIDLGNRGRDNDQLTQMIEAVGVLPDDAVRYTSMTLLDERPTRVAVQLDGTLYERPDVPVHTLYEVRPCEPGIRVRTELVNGTPDPYAWTLTDGWYWSLRALLPFTPGPGQGFDHPSFGLLTIDDGFRSAPFLAASSHDGAPAASYAEVACNQPSVEGFNSEVVSSAGLPRSVVAPRDYRVFERIILVAPRTDVAGAADLALGVRAQLFGEPVVTLTGTVNQPVAGEAISLLFYEGDRATPPAARVPWTQVIPDALGRFSASVPAARHYVVVEQLYGREVGQTELGLVTKDPHLSLPALPSAKISVSVVDSAGAPIHAELFVVPADDATAAAATGTFHGQWDACAPWLGQPWGGSPACNRFLVTPAGASSVQIATPGRYHLYAYHGPFWTLSRKTLDVDGKTDQSVQLQLTKLALAPAGRVSGDLHVHGAASFDSQIPDVDRVLSFAAADMDVIVATDHDVVTDYGAVLAQLGLDARISAVVGEETTGQIPWLKIPGSPFPLVIGHYNFWPLRFEPGVPRNGGPFDEFIEPGELFDRADASFTALPMYELNHPWAPSQFGRDLGFPRALALDARKDLPATDDGTAAGIYVRAPRGGHRNNEQNAQEVMNGTQNDTLQQYRAFWWYVLSQGQLVTGTANSDSHSLVDSTLGVPRNLVECDTHGGRGFDVDRFDQAIRDGKVLGTNGPIIHATVTAATGEEVGWGLAPFAPSEGGVLRLEVDAAPWVPVDEIRIIVNGKLVKTIAGDQLMTPVDPFGATGLTRFSGTVALAELLPSSGDAWLVVEAGTALLAAADLGGGLNNAPDGIPDTTDNNGDGKIDRADVAAGEKVGPLRNPDPPKDESDPRYHFAKVHSNSFPFAFTNPFILDRNGNGKFDPPKTAGSR